MITDVILIGRLLLQKDMHVNLSCQ